MSHTLRFDEPLATRPEYTGCKGANLALLTAGGFPVPSGFVVVAAGYREWLEGAPWWREAVPLLPVQDPSGLAVVATELRDRLRTVPLPVELVTDIRHTITGYPADTAFAVRSSSTMEDLAGAAFAGQHDTFLNCCGSDQVIEAVRECFISVWHDRVISYRASHGFDHFEANMAVVVQEMARCDAAGVAFSMNPLTGNLKVALIEANHGLGESVVSGECEVDDWEVEKTTGNILSRAIAIKSMRTICTTGGGTSSESLSGADSESPTLSDAQVSMVAGLLGRVEAWFRFPPGYRMGLVDNRLVLLQSRPITTIPPRWTRDESAERFPNPVTSLTWDFVDKGFRQSMRHSFRLMGFPAFSGQWFGRHGHYIHGNQNAVEIYARRFPFVLNSLADLPSLIPALREEFRWVQELPVQWSRDLDFYLIKIGEYMAEPLEDKSISELWRFVLNVKEHRAHYFLPNIAISISQSVLYRLLGFLLRELLGPEEVAPLMDGLLAFCETKTGAINKELYELAQLVEHDPLLEERLRTPAGSKALWDSGVVELEHKAFHRRFVRFLRDHGHREIDFDIYQPVWREVPWVVLDQVRLILDAPGKQSPAQRERELKVKAQAAEFSLFQRLPAELHFFLHEVIRLARVYTSLDDLEHYQTTRLALPLRKGLAMLGTRLVERGILQEPMDIFFAHEEEVSAALAPESPQKWLEFSAAIAAEKNSWRKAVSQAPGWEPNAPVLESVTPEPGMELSGLPGSPGIAEGSVFLVSGPQDFAAFPHGAVLIARTTSPTWTPQFYAASAVITESGGPLSHGAVTAREMRIPAVMSVRGCLTRLTNGCKVRVDGTRGKVVIRGD